MRTFPLPDTQPTLVGRDHELGVLRGQLAAALTGQGNLVLISGEAGIGKTALAETVCREAAERGAHVLVGRCYDLTDTPPYGPWIEMFGRYRHEEELPPLPAAFAVRGTVGETSGQVVLFHDVQDFLTNLSNELPLVLLLDDLQWTDPASIDLLRFLARNHAQHHALIIALYRAEELEFAHRLYQLLPALIREADPTRIAMRGLAVSAVHMLVQATYHLPEEDVVRLAAYLHGRTEGNPFFLREVLHALEGSDVLRLVNGTWMLGALRHVGVPLLVHQVLDARIARLGQGAQEPLQTAAVIGQEVPLALWERITQRASAELWELVEQASAARLVEYTPDNAQFRFTHALIREALYVGTHLHARQRIHRNIAETLAASPDPDPDAIAFHFQRASDERAGEWLIKAGARAQRGFALLTAAERYEAALAVLQERGADARARGWLLYHLAGLRKYADWMGGFTHLAEAAQLAAEAGDAHLAALILYEQGFLRSGGGDVRQGLDEMEAGIAALEALPTGDLEEHIGGVPIDPRYARAAYLFRLARIGRFADVQCLGEQWHAHARDHRTARATHASALVWHGLGLAYAHLGHREQARHAFSQALAAFKAIAHHNSAGGVLTERLELLTLPYHADHLAERRQLADEAEGLWHQAAEMGLAHAPQLAHAPLMVIEGRWNDARAVALAAYASGSSHLTRSRATCILAPIAYAQGDWALLDRLTRERLPDGPHTAPGTTIYSTMLHRMAVQSALDARDLEAASQWLEACDRWHAWSGAVIGRADVQLLHAQLHRATHEHHLAYRCAREALSAASEPPQPLTVLASHRALGELATEAGRYGDAREHLQVAIGLADACAAPYERALTLLALVALHATAGARTEALTVLDEARGICELLGAKSALAKADALAARVTSRAAPSPPNPAGLSAREVEVLRLITAGKTNREIADALFVSPATVNIHVTHILTKTNTANRAEAAAFATRHNLA